MTGYGPPVLANGILVPVGRVQNRFITGTQNQLLDFFGRLPDWAARPFARSARRLVGGYLYSLKLEVNDYCNLACRMCYVRRGTRELSLPLIRSILDQIRGCGVRLEILGGEPLLHPEIVEIVRYARSEARLPFVSLYTNGMDATPALTRDLKRAGLDAAIVSLISHRPEVHDDFTGRAGSFDRTIAGIRNLTQAGVKVFTFTAVHRYNYQDYQAIYHFVKHELKVHALYYQYIPQIKDDPLFIEPTVWHRIKRWVLYEQNPKHMEFVRRFYALTGNACSGGNFVLTVKADGSVSPCPFISDLPLGDITKTDLWTIYRNRYQNTRLYSLKCLPEECRDCAYRSVCAGGCRAGNKVQFGSYARKDPRCLGPFLPPLRTEQIIDRVPSFF
jgi:radical SAM protein with 4Fe4S-binding SPASM domain